MSEEPPPSREPEPGKWDWDLRLFLSVDVIDSTRLKQRQQGKRWARAFHEFFLQFPPAFMTENRGLREGSFGASVGPDPQVWKFLGDEILFHVRIRRIREVALHVAALLKVMPTSTERWGFKSPDGLRFELKGSAWIAGFPVRNYKLALASGLDSSLDYPDQERPEVLDFIGPHMDLGFRVAKCSRRNCVAMTPDLALLVLLSKEKLALAKGDSPVLRYEGREDLKGIPDRIPVVHAQSTPESEGGEAEQRARGWTPNDAALREFLEGYVGGESAPPRPFVDGDDEFPEYGVAGEDMIREREAIKNSEEGDMRSEGLGNDDEGPLPKVERKPGA